MAQNKGVPPETGYKQAVSIRIKLKWHEIKESRLKQVTNKLCQLGSS